MTSGITFSLLKAKYRMAELYATEEEMKERAAEGFYVRDGN